MAKKKSHPEQQPTVRIPDQSPNTILREIEDTWEKDFEEANRNYDAAMYGAWQRYISALRDHGDEKSGGTNFDLQYDKDRAAALARFHAASDSLDAKRERARKAVLLKTPQLRQENDLHLGN